jgi:hypothetical protein
MSRPVAVTASAVVAILGSLITLLFAAMLAASPYMPTPQPQPPHIAEIAIVVAAIFAALAGLGIWTAIGLFRLRSWARTSILVFAGFLGAWSALAMLVTMVIPTPPELNGGMGRTFLNVFIAVTFGTPLAIAIWWLIQFNAQSTKAAFTSAVTETGSRRPLSISIIGWTGVIGGAATFLWIPVRLPAFLFGATFNGWSAGVVYGLFGALLLYIGKGLLELRERARLLAIGWFVFGFVHTCVVTFVPPVRQRMLEMQRTLMVNQPTAVPFDQGILIYVTVAIATILTAVGIYFLIRNRPAFVRADS